MAKAVEDTAFYRYPRLVCLNEVGGMPSKFGTTIEEFHHQNAERTRSWPLSMTTTSTHDTKRGEDTSARIAVLSEMPHEWRRTVRRWSELARPARTQHDGEPAPSRSHEYLFYQTLVGAWPYGWEGQGGRKELALRLTAFVVKAAKEGKEQTSWTNPNAAYEEALTRFVERLLDDDAFVRDARQFCETIAPYGATNGLAQALLRLCSPGVPDTYQGCELWNQSLVDPDNRLPVDYDLRRRALLEVRERSTNLRALARDLLLHFADGRIKLHVTHQALMARRANRALFLRGDYEGLPAGDSVVAFTRALGAERLICCVARLSYLRTQGASAFPVGRLWGHDRLIVPYGGRYRNVLTGASLSFRGEVDLAEIFADLPVALLLREGPG
jgi:(1->4)-alpha-D-glucan 1-alpha-D-glucosylmutase